MSRPRRAAHRTAARILRRATHAAAEHDIGFMAAAVAFWTALSVFPAIALLVWLDGHLLGIADIRDVVLAATDTMPDSVRTIVERAVRASIDANPAERGAALPGPLGPSFGLALTVWSVNVGVQALFQALDRTFEVAERRTWLRLTGVSLLFTLAALAIVALAMATAVLLTHMLPPMDGVVLEASLRWAGLFAAFLLVVAALYRFAPSGGRDGWPFLTVGGVAAAAVLVAECGLFSWAVGRFATLAVTYGSLSTVVAFLLWLWLSVTVVLAGAELDMAVRRETALYGAGDDDPGQA